jgi:hypothetical protein
MENDRWLMTLTAQVLGCKQNNGKTGGAAKSARACRERFGTLPLL